MVDIYRCSLGGYFKHINICSPGETVGVKILYWEDDVADIKCS